MHRHGDAQKSVYGFEFFAHQSQREVIEPRAAITFRYADAEQIQAGHLVEDFAMEFLFLVPLFDIRRNFSLRKLAHGLHQGVVVVGKLKIDHVHPQITQITQI